MASPGEAGRNARSGTSWLRLGLDLLCPPRCVLCREEAPTPDGGGPVVCDPCQRMLSHEAPRCPACGEPLPPAGVCVGCCGPCDWDGIAILAAYDDEMRRLVLRGKRPGGEAVAAGLAALLVHRHRETLAAWRLDLVVPVPMHWLRRTLRGADSAGELARGVASGLGLPRRAVLRRIRRTPMQNRLPIGERRANVAAAFRAGGRVASLRVLLVDDVATTGSTLAACREVLVAAGAAAVFAAVVARADRGCTADRET